jgi:hypothetical protein
LSLFKNTNTFPFSEIDGSDIQDEPVVISQHNDNNDTGAPQHEDDANANEDTYCRIELTMLSELVMGLGVVVYSNDNWGNAVAGPKVLAHVDMAKTGRK